MYDTNDSIKFNNDDISILINLQANNEYEQNDELYIFTLLLIFICLVIFIMIIIIMIMPKNFIKSIYCYKFNNMKLMKKSKLISDHSNHQSLLELSTATMTKQKSVNIDENKMSSSIENCIENLNLIEIICEGKYGKIWKGKFNDKFVTIKIFSNKNHEHFWQNELDIYSLLSNINLSNFFRHTEHVNNLNGQIEHCLIIEYGHYGSLQTYLNEHTFDWVRMCQLYKSLIQGLVYLHTEINDNNLRIKPSIAHCDLCSSNVIVKADGTCMICDFQFAVKFLPEVNHRQSLSQIINQHELKSGRFRYLSPEILDDSMNLRPSESLLKQSDIYALGLILWEIASRCTDLYQGIDVPNYKLPYENEIGLTPTLEQMRLLVNKHRARPLFPDIWKDSNHAIRLLKETINECWDHEPEARLTALCINERINELTTLWKRHKMEILSNFYILSKLLSENSSNDDINDKINGSSFNESHNKENQSNNICYINEFENSLHSKLNDYNHLLHYHKHNHHYYKHFKHYFYHHQQQQQQKFSLNNSKFLNNNLEKNFTINNDVNNNNDQSYKLTLPLQPYHARNPCLERNLLLNNNNNDDNIDNIKIDEIMSNEYSKKFKKNYYDENNHINLNIIAPSSPAVSSNHDNDTIEILQDQSSIDNRPTAATIPTPIPFVQNQCNDLDNNKNINEMKRIKDVNKYRNLNRHQRNYLFKFFKKQNRLFNFLREKFLIESSSTLLNKKQSQPIKLIDSTKFNEPQDIFDSNIRSTIMISNRSINHNRNISSDHSSTILEIEPKINNLTEMNVNIDNTGSFFIDSNFNNNYHFNENSDNNNEDNYKNDDNDMTTKDTAIIVNF